MKTQNTFSDGLNMDVNPLVAPKTVMSNCLNGTLITYNGNENVLQNDMGNGKVHYAYLPQGWVPVGMAEHGGIIYVAAYNPETKESLLGSFPSPQLRFENNKTGKKDFVLTPGKYKLFTDKDLELKPGNKLAVALENSPYDIIEPNFNNDNLKHKRHWGILLCLLTSNGILTDITSYLSTLATPDKAKEYDTLEKYKDYFFIQAIENAHPDYLVDNLRIYSGTLVGVPYVNVVENLASAMNVEILPGIVTDNNGNKEVQFKVKCEIISSSQLFGYKGELGLKGVRWRIHESWQGRSYENIQLIPQEVINSIEEGLEYIINMEFLIDPNFEVPNVLSSNDITIELEPMFNWGTEYDVPQTDLLYTLTFDVTKIGTGIHEINQWRYYYTEDYLTLTWGMESYPALGEEMKNALLLIINYYKHIVYTLSLEHDFYNGEFTEVIDSSIFQNKLPHIAKISWKVGDLELADYRWIIPTKLYNQFYQAKRVNDFFKYTGEYGLEMRNLSKITGNILEFVNEPVERVESTNINNIVPFYTQNPYVHGVTLTNKYTYTINPKIRTNASLNEYPFEIDFTQPSSVTFKHDTVESVNFISNELSILHNIEYRKKLNIHVTKLFTNHKLKLLEDRPLCYLVIGVTRLEGDADNNKVMYYSYYVDKNENHTYLTPRQLIGEVTDESITWQLSDYWFTISSELTILQRKNNQFVIPIVFFCERIWLKKSSISKKVDSESRLLGLNYAVKKENNWCLYWENEFWVGADPSWNWSNEGDYDLLNYVDLKNLFVHAPATVYEARTERYGFTNLTTYKYGFPFVRCERTNGSSVEGYLITNASNNVIQETEEEFTFSVEVSSDINIYIDAKSKQPYNKSITQFLSEYFIKTELPKYLDSLLMKNRISKYFAAFQSYLHYNNSLNNKVSLEYTYLNIRPGNYELWQIIDNFNITGIETLLSLANEQGVEYVIPKEQLNESSVYLIMEDNSLVEKHDAIVESFNNENYIVGSEDWEHSTMFLTAHRKSNWCALDLQGIPTLRGYAIFGGTLELNVIYPPEQA